MADLNDDLMQELQATFRHEAAEHLQTLNGALLAFERATVEDEQTQHVQAAFRAAHSLKGAARAVSMESIQSLAHAIETVFQGVRDRDAVLEPAHCDVLYDALDTIQQVLEDDTVDTTPLLGRLRDIAGETPPEDDKPKVKKAAGVAATNETRLESSETIRVSLHKLDDLMAEVGELLVSRISNANRMTKLREISKELSRWNKSWSEIKLLMKRQPDTQLADAMLHHADIMQAVIDDFATLEQHTQQDVMRLDMVTNNLQEKVRQVRMIPFSVQNLALERVVRDAARTENKQVQFEIIGSHIELDKKILELLKDPLIHLLRNAISHGIEPAGERAPKPENGQIQLIVEQRGSEVHIQVKDDGRGFQLDQLEAAYQQHFNGHAPENPINAAFMPGVTTRPEVNEIAGRGIGLDVVRERLESIHGRFSVSTESGQGTTITLIVPTSLAITRMLLVQVGRSQYALPLMSIEKIVMPDNVFTLSGKPMLRVDDVNLPMAALSHLLGTSQNVLPEDQLALIISTGDQRIAVLVDDVLTEQELAVKPLTFPIKQIRNITGAALLGSGEPIVVLNPADFIHTYRGYRPTLESAPTEAEPASPATRVLVVDDSITTRTLERNILEAAGYDVVTAIDGVEALERLEQCDVHVVVSDIEMPNMDGFELTERLRDADHFGHLPIILVTSLESEGDRERGMMAGADAYIVKRGFDQAELLTMIDQLA